MPSIILCVVAFFMIGWGLLRLSRWLFIFISGTGVVTIMSKLPILNLILAIGNDVVGVCFVVSGIGLLIGKEWAHKLARVLLLISISQVLILIGSAQVYSVQSAAVIISLISQLFIFLFCLVIIWKTSGLQKRMESATTTVLIPKKVFWDLRIIAVAIILDGLFWVICFIRKLIEPAHTYPKNIPDLMIATIMFGLFPLLAGAGLWGLTKWGHVFAVLTLVVLASAFAGMAFWGHDVKGLFGLLLVVGIGLYLLTPRVLRACRLLESKSQSAS